MKDVFVVAMDVEADAVVRNMTDVLRFEESGRVIHQGLLKGEPTAVVVAGIGKVNAAAGTQYAIDHFSPERIVNVGVAGGIDASMKVAQLYSISKCFQCDFDLSVINPTPRGTVNEYDSPYFDLEPFDTALPQTIVSSGDFFANDNHDRAFVYDEMGAWLRDMELGAIAHVCKRAGMRCCSLKSVSDVNYPGCPKPVEQYIFNLKKAVDALAEKVRSSEF